MNHPWMLSLCSLTLPSDGTPKAKRWDKISKAFCLLKHKPQQKFLDTSNYLENCMMYITDVSFSCNGFSQSIDSGPTPAVAPLIPAIDIRFTGNRNERAFSLAYPWFAPEHQTIFTSTPLSNPRVLGSCYRGGLWWQCLLLNHVDFASRV